MSYQDQCFKHYILFLSRSGSLQLGDRIICINSQQNLTANAANDVLQKRNDTNCIRYLNLKAEFSMADSVEASSGVFNVKLAKSGAGLGVTITGNNFNLIQLIHSLKHVHISKMFLISCKIQVINNEDQMQKNQ